MHDHDLDLVAAYADGVLDGDTSDVERLVSTCEICRTEFESQRQIRELLRAAAPVELDAHERQVIRDRVWARLQSEIHAAPARTPAPRRPLPWWFRLAPVAAGVLVAVVGVGIFLQSGGGVESTGGAELAVEMTTTVAAEAAATTAAPASEVSPAAEGTYGDMAAEEPAEEMGAARAVTAPLVDLGETTLEEIEQALDRLSESALQPDSPDGRRKALACAGPIEGEITATVTGTVDGVPVEAYLVFTTGGPEVLVLTLPDCTPLES